MKRQPVFQYFSVCCNAPAEKPPCAKGPGAIGTLGSSPKEAEGSLGSWRCSRCGKACKCVRTQAENKA